MINSISDIDSITPTTLIEEFKSGSINEKIHSAKNINTIILCLGQKRTIEEFVPFLIDYCEDEEVSVILEINNQIINVIKFLDPNNISDSIHLWIKLSLMEEMTIKTNCIDSLQHIVKYINSLIENKILNESTLNDYKSIFVKYVDNLYSNNEYYMLYNVIKIFIINSFIIDKKSIYLTYLKNNALIDNYKANCFLIDCLFDLISYITTEDLIQIIKNSICTKDYSVLLKYNVVNLIANMYFNLKNLNTKSTEYNSSAKIILEFIKEYIFKEEDLKVKLALCSTNNAHKFIHKLEFSILKSYIDLINSYILLQDIDIKENLCNIFPIIYEACILNNLEKEASCVLNNYKTLAKDSNIKIRKAFSYTYLDICKYISINDINEIIMPTLLDILNDDNIEVKIQLLKNINKLNVYNNNQSIYIEEIFTAIYPKIVEISENKSWRCRLELKNIVFILQENIKNKNIFIDKIFPIFLNWLIDPVYAVRTETILIIYNILTFNNNYLYDQKIHSEIINTCNKLKNNQSYLVRVSLAKFINQLTKNEYLKKEYVEKNLLNIIIDFANNDISNVALNCKEVLSIFIDNKKYGKDIAISLNNLKNKI